MTAAKIRVGGAWVDATKSGKVRIGGAWVDFGPSGSFEALAWPNTTPNLTDAVDGSTRYNMGIQFQLTTPKNCVGVQWRCPDTTPIPDVPGSGTLHRAQLWPDGGGTVLAEKTFTPTPGAYQNIMFDAPVALSVFPVRYVVSIYTWHYVHRVATWPISSPSGNVVAEGSRLISDAGYTYPSGSFSAWYYVSPLVTV